MRVVIQRVANASVSVNNELISSIATGLLVFLGIEDADDHSDIEWLSNKISNLRIFNDDKNIPNLSVKDINGNILVVSQFTLHALTKKGNRPSYIMAASPEKAIILYKDFIESLNKCVDKEILTGEFGADMKVSLLNDGPVTILIDSKNKE